MDTAALRDTFLIPEVMVPGDVRLVYTHHDRFIAGGAVPTDVPLALETPPELRADFLLERRELGVINVGQSGTVTVDGTAYAVGHREALYVGRGSREVTFASDDASAPARFYLNPAPAHAAYPTTKVSMGDAQVVEAGSHGRRAAARPAGLRPRSRGHRRGYGGGRAGRTSGASGGCRAVEIGLTAAGRSVIEACHGAAAEAERQMTGGLSRAETGATRAALLKLCEALEAQ